MPVIQCFLAVVVSLLLLATARADFAGDVAVYNDGVADYRADRLDDATTKFQAAAVSSDTGLAARARYNLGSVRFRMATSAIGDGEIEMLEPDVKTQAVENLTAAIDHYRSSLRLNPDDADARANIEKAARLIERLRAQPPPSDAQSQPESQPQSQPQSQPESSGGPDGDEDQQRENEDRSQQPEQSPPDDPSPQSESSAPSESSDEPGSSGSSDQADASTPSQSESESESEGAESEGAESENAEPEDAQAEPNSDAGGDQPAEADADSDPSDNASGSGNTGASESTGDGTSQRDRPGTQAGQGNQPPDRSETSEAANADPIEPNNDGKLSAANPINNETANDESANGETLATQTGPIPPGGITEQEARKMLQAIRDRDMLRRLQRQSELRNRRIPVDRDW